MRLGVALLVGLLVSSVGCSKKDEPVVRMPVALEAPRTQNGAEAMTGEAVFQKTARETPAYGVETEINPATFAHVIQIDGHSFVVVHEMPDADHWSVGNPSLLSADSPVITRKEVNDAALPPSILREKGLEVHLIKNNKNICRGKLGAFSMLGRVEPYYSARAVWAGEEAGADSETRVHSPEQIAEEAWEMTNEGHLLVAELVETKGDCKDAEYARSTTLPMPKAVVATAAPHSLEKLAIAEFRALPDYQTIADIFAETELAKSGAAWDELDGATPTITLFSSPQGSYVWLSAFSGGRCTEFEGKLDVLFQVEGALKQNPTLRLVYEGTSDFYPTSMLMLGDDATPTLMGFQSTLAKRRNGFFEVKQLDLPFLDCPC